MTPSHNIRQLLLVFLLSLTLPVHAAFITDRIEVPLYAEKHNQGAVLKKLLSGTQVDILMKDGEFTRISTRDGATGWVEFKFISTEKPLGLEFLELRSQYKTLQKELTTAQQKLNEPHETTTPGISTEELAKLHQEAKDTRWMRAEMNKSREQVKKLKTELKALRTNTAKQSDNSSAVQEELIQLHAQNQDLQNRLAAALLISENEEQRITDATVEVAAPVIETTSVNSENNAWSVSLEWFFGSLAAAFIIGVIGGVRWLDRRIRAKHGGFRIY